MTEWSCPPPCREITGKCSQSGPGPSSFTVWGDLMLTSGCTHYVDLGLYAIYHKRKKKEKQQLIRWAARCSSETYTSKCFPENHRSAKLRSRLPDRVLSSLWLDVWPECELITRRDCSLSHRADLKWSGCFKYRWVMCINNPLMVLHSMLYVELQRSEGLFFLFLSFFGTSTHHSFSPG